MLDVALKDANESWSELRVLVDEKKEEFIHAEMIQKFLLDGSETEAWIEEKAEIIDQTRDYGDSLSGVMALQRKLGRFQHRFPKIRKCSIWIFWFLQFSVISEMEIRRLIPISILFNFEPSKLKLFARKSQNPETLFLGIKFETHLSDNGKRCKCNQI